MNPFKYAQMMKYLTRAKKQKPDLPDVFRASQAPIPEKTLTRDMFKEAQERFKNAKAGGGMLVKPTADGSRPGYKSDFSKKELKKFGKTIEKREITDKLGRKFIREVFVLKGKDQNDFYNEFYKNNPNKPRYFGKEFTELSTSQRQDVFDSYVYQKKLAQKPDRGYITTKELSKLVNPDSDINFIKNGLLRTIGKADAAKGRKLELTSKYLKTLLKPKKFKVRSDLKGNIADVIHVKNNATIIKMLRDYYNGVQLRPETMKNIEKILKNDEIKKLFRIGSYDRLVEAIDNLKIPNAQKSTTIFRIAQHMDGIKFKNFKPDIPKNINAANKIFVGLEKAQWGDPYADAYRQMKRDEIMKMLGTGYFDKSYQNFIKDARAVIAAEVGEKVAKTLDLNEITGLTSASKGKTFSSSQFVNFMDSHFNRNAHASMIKEYGKYEKNIAKALKNNNRYQANKLINKWDDWRKGWFKNLDDKYKTKAVADIVPTFKIGADPYGKIFSNQRLKQLLDLEFDPKKDYVPGQKLQLAKTFKSQSTQPILKEVAQRDERALRALLAAIGCPEKRARLQAGTNCPTKGANVINSGMKNVTPAQAKNFAAFANRAASLGRGVMKYGVIPEALYVAADSLIRVGMGDNFNEAFLRATQYLSPFDNVKKAEMLEADRFFGPEIAGIIGKSIDYKNELAKVQSLEDQKANLENLSGIDEFDYIGDLSQDVKNIDAQLKQATDNLNNKFKTTDAERIYAERMKDEIDDARSAGSLFTKLKSKFRDAGQDQSDIETLGVPEKTQEQLNQRMLPQAPTIYKFKDGKLITKNLSESSFDEIQDHVNLLKSVGIKDSSKNLLEQRNMLRGMPLSRQEQIFGKEQTYGASGTTGEPINKPVFKRPQNVIGDIEKEIVGQTNVVNPFDIDISDIGTGLRGFSAAGGGIAKQAGVSSGPPPDSGPNPQGLSYLMKRGKNI